MRGSGFQVVIVSSGSTPSTGQNDQMAFDVNQHGRGGEKLIARIEALEGIWDRVVEKLTGIAEKSQIAATASKFEMSSIEFNVGIEAGLNVGLVTKGEASVTLTFTLRRDAT